MHAIPEDERAMAHIFMALSRTVPAPLLALSGRRALMLHTLYRIRYRLYPYSQEYATDPKQLNFLRTKTDERDIAFLRTGVGRATYPVNQRRESVTLAPLGVQWEAESAETAGKTEGSVHVDHAS